MHIVLVMLLNVAQKLLWHTQNTDNIYLLNLDTDSSDIFEDDLLQENLSCVLSKIVWPQLAFGQFNVNIFSVSKFKYAFY